MSVSAVPLISTRLTVCVVVTVATVTVYVFATHPKFVSRSSLYVRMSTSRFTEPLWKAGRSCGVSFVTGWSSSRAASAPSVSCTGLESGGEPGV